MQWRQGDIYICGVAAIPELARPVPGVVLAEGEATGHCHRILETEQVQLLETFDGLQFLRVATTPVTLFHDEHAPITLPPGEYRYWRQREYTPHGIRMVMD